MSDEQPNKLQMYGVFSKEAIRLMKGPDKEVNLGKLVAQAGHAYLHAFWDAEKRFPDLARTYRDSSHAYKIGVAVETEADLIALMESHQDRCGVSLVRDAGFTVFNGPTVTCLGIGPIWTVDRGEDLAGLKLLRKVK